MPIESTAPIVRSERTAIRLFPPEIFDIAGSSLRAVARFQWILRSAAAQLNRNRPPHPPHLSSAPAPRFALGPVLPKLSSTHPVTRKFLDNIRVHGLRIGDVHLALGHRAVPLLGKAPPVERRRQPRIDLQGGVEIRGRVFGLPALEVDKATAVGRVAGGLGPRP